MSVSTITYKNKNMIIVDCSDLNGLKKDEIVATLIEGSKVVAKSDLNNAYVITIIVKTHYNTEIFEAFKNYASVNTKYVKASAIVGLEGMEKIMFSAIKRLTKRDYYIAKSMEDAKDYLADII